MTHRVPERCGRPVVERLLGWREAEERALAWQGVLRVHQVIRLGVREILRSAEIPGRHVRDELDRGPGEHSDHRASVEVVAARGEAIALPGVGVGIPRTDTGESAPES